MNRSLPALLALTVVCLLSGCVSYERRTPPDSAFSGARNAWTIDEAAAATVGDLILAEGAEVRTGPAYVLTRPLAFSMPGRFGVRFQCALEPCILEPRAIVGDKILFVAPEGAGSAEFNGKSVFLPQDELGIRVDRRTSAVELYCDNSRFNGIVPGFAVWKRAATPEEWSAFSPTSCDRLFWLPRSAALRYSGSSSGEVRFTFSRYERGAVGNGLVEVESTEYRFDVPAAGQGEIAVRGALIEILSITPSELRYQVRRGFSLPSDRDTQPPVRPAPVAEGKIAESVRSIDSRREDG